MVRCEKCGHSNNKEISFCVRCGSELSHLLDSPNADIGSPPTDVVNLNDVLEKDIICPKCGENNSMGNSFCISCSNIFKYEEESTGLKEKLRDKSRDELTSYLTDFAKVKAQMGVRGRPEEKVENSWYQRSLGVIDIADGPIKWISILKRDRSKDSPPKWWVVMGIPFDGDGSGIQKIGIKTVRKKAFPLFGKVVDVTWKGDDGVSGLINILSQDTATKELSKKIGNLEIKSQSEEFRGWTLTSDRKFVPTSEGWETIQRIANHILSAPRAF
ncbi:MAG: Double zinc ribbon [Chloroflexi bacterium]|jgi:hypothetical protein|nr:MAG: Double zinc ribbon [Chloroflexota bacterium]